MTTEEHISAVIDDVLDGRALDSTNVIGVILALEEEFGFEFTSDEMEELSPKLVPPYTDLILLMEDKR